MKHTLLLVWRHVSHYWGRSLILVLCIALVFFLPIAVNLLVGHFERDLRARARSIPLLVGAKGSRYDLAINALYYRGRVSDRLDMAEVEAIRATGFGLPVPVVTGHTAKGHPVVGTSLEYFERVGHTLRAGTLPLRLGDAVLGAAVADELGLAPGDHLVTDVEKLYDISASYSLRLRITGVLDGVHGADDRAVFCDVKTAWVIEGIGHGHADVEDVGERAVLKRDGQNVAVDDSIFHEVRITPENLDSFHFHGEPESFPVTAVLVWPQDAKSRTKLLGRYSVSKHAQMLTPTAVVEELLGFVFEAKRFFDANTVLVGIAAWLFLALIAILSARIRRREMETLARIGAGRMTAVKLQGLELLGLLLAGVGLAVLLSAGVFWYVVEHHLIV